MSDCREETSRLHLLGAVFPICAGLALYGWRALGVLLLTTGAAGIALAFWRGVGPAGAGLKPARVIWLSLLGAMALPAHLLSLGYDGGVGHPWALAAAIGILIVIFCWLRLTLNLQWAHPFLPAILLAALLFQDIMRPRMILHRRAVFVGNLLDVSPAPPAHQPASADDSWIARNDRPTNDALWVRTDAATRLSQFTRGRLEPGQTRLALEEVLRDAVPPLEDLLVGGHPGPIGSSSVIAVLVGGLFLLYRNAINHRVPMMTVVFAYLGLLVFPVPVLVTDSDVQWRSLALPHANLDWGTIITFANYEMAASPLMLVAFFVATEPGVAPRGIRGQVFHGMLIGVLCAAAQLYVSVSYGPYLAACVATLLVPWLDDRDEYPALT